MDAILITVRTLNSETITWQLELIELRRELDFDYVA